MANYREETVSGAKWQRCRSLTIDNPLDGQPVAYFKEEEAITIGAQVSTRDVSVCSMAFDPEQTIPLMDPTTGTLTGSSMTHAELYAVLFSLYMQAAAARDALA